MASSLFGSNAKPQASNPFQAAMAAAQELKHSNPEQLMEKMMEANPQFAAFVNQNKGKSPEQIARENGIDFNMVQKMFLDTITGNRMADMQNQINQLQLSQALCGVVRYPNTFAYNAGPSPFCGNGCCGTANI